MAEHDGVSMNPSTAKCVTCARSFSAETIDIVVLADDGEQVANEAAKLAGVTTVIILHDKLQQFLCDACNVDPVANIFEF